MRQFLGILIGKCILWIGKLVHRGSSLPGEITLRFDPKILSKFQLPSRIIAVTGSSGKGSISGMLAQIFREQGYEVAHNKDGANLTAGITTLLLEHTTFSGKIKANVLIYEIDERYTKQVFPIISPDTVIISNISRDQPPRQGHFDLVFEEIKKALTPKMHLILNGDDPYLRKFTLDPHYSVTYYGVDRMEDASETSLFKNLNLNYCPVCGSKLEYHYYNFESLGDYYCRKCHFQRPSLSYIATKLDYETNQMIINQEYEIHLPYNVLYCVYNTLAAFTTAAICGLHPKKTADTISKIGRNQKNFDEFQYQNRLVHVLNNKNENSSTFNQSLLYVKRYQEEKTIVIGWKEISRRYNFDDLSWLYDIDFEILKDLNVDKIVCIGIHRYDIATRMKYAGFKEDKIIVFDRLEESANYIKTKTKGNIYAILNFDYVEPFKQVMREGKR